MTSWTFPKLTDLSATADETSITVSFSEVKGVPSPDRYQVCFCAGTSIAKVLFTEYISGGGLQYTIKYGPGFTPGSTYTVAVRAMLSDGSHSAAWATRTVTTTPVTAISQAQVATMLAFMYSQIGKPYTQVNPTRFGPTAYDCSGLIYAASQAAGIELPQSQATANVEIGWFAAQQGAQLIMPGLGAVALQAGDIVGCTGEPPSPVVINGVTYQIGHIGMMSSDGISLISALNTQYGVTQMNVSYLSPQVAVRPQA